MEGRWVIDWIELHSPNIGLNGFHWRTVRCRPATAKAMTYCKRCSGSGCSAITIYRSLGIA